MRFCAAINIDVRHKLHDDEMGMKMTPIILVVGSRVEQLQEFVAGFPTQYAWQVAAVPEEATSYLDSEPSLVLLQLEAVGSNAPLWNDFCRSCELSGISTIVFSLNGASAGQMNAVLPWCAEFLDVTLPIAAQQNYLQLHIQCQRLQQQLDLAEGRLFEKNLELKEGLQSAAYIQQTLMPHVFPDLPQLHFVARFIPCQNVGGDIFNVVRLDEDTLMAYMLDVSGHGVSAAMVTVSVFQALSAHTGQIIKRSQDLPPYYHITPPAQVLQQLDLEYPFERFEKFFTMNYFLINPNSGAVRFANAAHPPAIVVRVDGSLEHLDAEGTIVGMGGLVPYEEECVTLAGGDRLFLYTDGIIEHENREQKLFSQQRLDSVLQQHRHLTLEAQCQYVIDELQQFGGDQFNDDVTLLGISFGA